ncbi:hypothetical protein [uncultured Jatrophihabitans sp.]|uniref:hypothetical protein n=1 Tax=uncultured Jatrophihabitans sp. TaxID=1610747 RepID=UPI0035CAF4C8
MLLRRRTAAIGVLATLALLVAGCTSGSGPSSSAPTSAPVATSSSTVGSPSATAPVSSGPTTASASRSCPVVAASVVHDTLGVRLGRTTVLRSGGTTVGCRFYAQQRPNSDCGASCLAGERLPGPNQPVAEVTTQRYPSAIAAHNAFVRRAGSAPGVTQVEVGGVTGLCFQNDFYPRDRGQDWACTVNKGLVVVLVRTVDTTGTFNTASVLTSVLRAVPA